MAGFIYFVPGGRMPYPEEQFNALLPYADAGGGLDNRDTSAGPGGQAGVLVVPLRPGTTANAKPIFDKEKQTWRQGPGGKFWVGFDNDAQPGPADLVRAKVYPGNRIKMLDGSEWVIPRVYAIQELAEARPTTLPVAWDLAEDGETTIGRSHPKFQGVCESAFKLFMESYCGKKDELSPAQRKKLAVDALQINYRVGLIEIVALLGLWDDDTFWATLRATIDADEIDDWLAHQKAKVSPEATEGAVRPTSLPPESATASGGTEDSGNPS